MKIQITQSNLNKALGLLSRVASSRTPLPILSNILLKASGGKLELAATNLEVALTHQTSGKIDEEGSVAVPARLLHDFVAQLPKDLTVDLVFEETKLFIKAGAYSSHIQGNNTEDFPALPVISSGETVSIDGQILKSALERTMLAASGDETRPVLGGIYFHTVEGKLFIAATDGYRLAESEITDVATPITAIVPASALQDALKIIQDNSGEDVTVQFGEGQFGVKAGESQLVSRLIDGQYPEYRQLIPETSEISVNISRSELLTAAKLAGLFARESGGSITLKASETDQQLVVKSVASQVGDNSSAIKGEVSGSGEVVVNVRYLTDALNAFEVDSLNFRFSGSISPCVLTSDDQAGYQHIVMPLKT
jgi:DNA polymerase-3 subunit beta